MTVDLTKYIGLPGGPGNKWDAERLASNEASFARYDHLGKRVTDPPPGEHPQGTPGCVCQGCRFYRGEGGVRLVMCLQKWNALPGSVQADIAESVAD